MRFYFKPNTAIIFTFIFIFIFIFNISAQNISKNSAGAIRDSASINFNKSISLRLQSVLFDDQNYRSLLDEQEKKYRPDSKQVKNARDTIKKKDEANLKYVLFILDNYGWPGPSVVGKNGASAIFLVIQHSDQKTQEKYLPMMQDAVKKGNASASDLALLEDRIAIGQGKKQIYGSQLSQDPETGKYVLNPIEDETNVNSLRKAVGLEPIEEYVKQWGITYKPGMSNLNLTRDKIGDNKIVGREEFINIFLSLLSIGAIFFVSFLLYKSWK